jgi:hypothetical protein
MAEGGARASTRVRSAAVAIALAVVAAGCGGDKGRTSNGGIFGDQGTGGATASVSPGEPVLLTAPAGTAPATVQAAATVVRERLTRMKVNVSAVTAQADAVAVTSSADAYQLQAAARRGATTIATIAGSTLGPCHGSGSGDSGPAARCYALGPTVVGVGAVSDAEATSAAGTGWKVTLSVDADAYRSLRGPLQAAGQAPVALVSDGIVVLAFDSGLPGLRSELGPGLTEQQARQTAAALVVDSDLPVALVAPPLPFPQGARVNLDFWTAALGVHVCGAWLANAPPAGLDTGVHSHGDGLVYIHPFSPDEAGKNATLGLFLRRGIWKVTQDSLQVWDGTTHHNGDTCSNGGPAEVRWWVDGVEQHGDPGGLIPRDGQVIVLGFDSDPTPPGPPPQATALRLPALTATAD